MILEGEVMTEYRTKPFLLQLEKEGVTSRRSGPIPINTLMALQKKLKLTVQRRARDHSRIWTDEHKAAIKEYWLQVEAVA